MTHPPNHPPTLYAKVEFSSYLFLPLPPKNFRQNVWPQKNPILNRNRFVKKSYFIVWLQHEWRSKKGGVTNLLSINIRYTITWYVLTEFFSSWKNSLIISKKAHNCLFKEREMIYDYCNKHATLDSNSQAWRALLLWTIFAFKIFLPLGIYRSQWPRGVSN